MKLRVPARSTRARPAVRPAFQPSALGPIKAIAPGDSLRRPNVRVLRIPDVVPSLSRTCIHPVVLADVPPKSSSRRADAVARAAAHIAALSKHLIVVFARRGRALAVASWQTSRRVAQRAYRLYLRFEAAFSAGMADFVLLSWSLRYFFLLIAVQIALIWGAFYFPVLWLFAVIVFLVLSAASLEVIRDYRAGEIDTPRDYSDSAHDLTATIIRWLFRFATAVLTVIMLVYGAKAYYFRFGLWPLLPMPRVEESEPQSVSALNDIIDRS